MSWALPPEAATFRGWPPALDFATRALKAAQSSPASASLLDEMHSEPPLIWPETATTSILFDTSAVSTSLPELKPVASISTPFASPGVKDIGKQCAHFAKPSLIFGVSAAATAVAASVIAIRTKARWKNFAITALRYGRLRRRLFQSS